ncbi:MAG: carboxylesterase family protein [Actinomycetia bacterium]|nr:carboxylesterase family protein [Actinomycetes bacterium]
MTDAPQHLLPWQIVTAPAGSFRTVREDGVVRARGIRYAEAQRFAAPATFSYPQTTPQQPFTADTPAPACPQRHQDTDERLIALGFDEHCQRLSITRPEDERTDRPVLLWIHGGSYTGGAGDLPHYDPRWLVREQGVIVVSVTYRLGLFGYLGDAGSREANAGLLDQLEALRWTHRNIAAFGGDPDNITVAGQSAGGHAAWDLLLAADAQGPATRMIRRAIVQSAPLGSYTGGPSESGRPWPPPPSRPSGCSRRPRSRSSPGNPGSTGWPCAGEPRSSCPSPPATARTPCRPRSGWRRDGAARPRPWTC